MLYSMWNGTYFHLTFFFHFILLYSLSPSRLYHLTSLFSGNLNFCAQVKNSEVVWRKNSTKRDIAPPPDFLFRISIYLNVTTDVSLNIFHLCNLKRVCWTSYVGNRLKTSLYSVFWHRESEFNNLVPERPPQVELWALNSSN